MKDFTFEIYTKLLKTFTKYNYHIYTLEEYLKAKKNNVLKSRFVILRHDVDRKPGKSLIAAKIEKELSIKASYYFRIGKESNQPAIIKQIASMGHEIGYHYEDLAFATGDYKKALSSFEQNLDYFRQYYPVKTMCMHGSPMSKWDNRDLWKMYSYKKYGIIAEPYFDLNFNEIFYLTDASRLWNNTNITRRDKVKSNFDIEIDSVNEIMSLIENNKFPKKVLLNTHPQNWTDNKWEWYKILLWQGFKNQVKKQLK